jgi:hypothetical protein
MLEVRCRAIRSFNLVAGRSPAIWRLQAFTEVLKPDDVDVGIKVRQILGLIPKPFLVMSILDVLNGMRVSITPSQP